MVIGLIWIGLICCGVASGLIYDHVEVPHSYYYMVIPSAIAIMLLVIHYHYTMDWCKPRNKAKKNGIRHQHFQVFGLSAMFSAAAFLSSVLSVRSGETSWGFFIGSAMVAVSFFIATARESNYV